MAPAGFLLRLAVLFIAVFAFLPAASAPLQALQAGGHAGSQAAGSPDIHALPASARAEAFLSAVGSGDPERRSGEGFDEGLVPADPSTATLRRHDRAGIAAPCDPLIAFGGSGLGPRGPPVPASMS